MNYNEIIIYARNNRKQPTEAEKKLWEVIRKRKLNGKKFLRQHPLRYQSYNNDHKFFIADFYCAEHKLVIELDGKIHEYQKEYDENRDAILENLGLKVLRINNKELENMNDVIRKICEAF